MVSIICSMLVFYNVFHIEIFRLILTWSEDYIQGCTPDVDTDMYPNKTVQRSIMFTAFTWNKTQLWRHVQLITSHGMVSVGCNYLPLPSIPVSGTHTLMCDILFLKEWMLKHTKTHTCTIWYHKLLIKYASRLLSLGLWKLQCVSYEVTAVLSQTIAMSLYSFIYDSFP